ncbi:hypothetical protein BDV93DRAFT_104337 [Ceratobasidium sp. AG-I]|nr:hypothetical protein BDV93DRAFT_104337 [Ceratobasidium sp. AG-I]
MLPSAALQPGQLGFNSSPAKPIHFHHHSCSHTESKNEAGSILRAEVQSSSAPSLPHGQHARSPRTSKIMIIFAPTCSASLVVRYDVRPPGDDVDRNCEGNA